MRVIVLGIFFFIFIGCSQNPIERHEDAAMPEVEEIIKEEKVPYPEKIVMLFDYSGSMRGNYQNDLASCDAPKDYFYKKQQFTNFVSTWMDASLPSKTTTKAELLLFNAQLWSLSENGKLSKFTDIKYPFNWKNGNPSDLQTWFDAIPDNPYTKVTKKTPNTTLTKEALQKVINAIEDDAIVWLVTDNLTDAGPSEEAQNNKAFYNLLKSDDRIRAVLGYPINLSTPESWLCGRSLFAYGMYVSKSQPKDQTVRLLLGEGASEQSAQNGMLWNTKLAEISKKYSCQKDSKGKAIRLKPIYKDVLTVKLNGLSVDSVSCNKVTMSHNEASCVAKISISNNLNHQVVEQADILLQNQTLRPSVDNNTPSWISDIKPKSMKIKYWKELDGPKNNSEKIQILNIKPKETREIEVKFSLENPKVSYPSISEVIAVANTSEVGFSGQLYVTVDNIKTFLQTEEKEITCINNSEKIPDIFAGQSTQKAAHDTETMQFKLVNSGKEQALIIMSGFTLLGLAFVGVLWRYRRISVDVKVDGQIRKEHMLSLAKFSRTKVTVDESYSLRIIVKRGAKKSFSVHAGRGCDLRPLGDNKYVVSKMDDTSIRKEIEVSRTYGSSSGSTSLTDPSAF